MKREDAKPRTAGDILREIADRAKRHAPEPTPPPSAPPPPPSHHDPENEP